MFGCCDLENELSGSINFGEFICLAKKLLAFKKGYTLCSWLCSQLITGTYHMYVCMYVFPPPMAQQPPLDKGLLNIEASRSHSDTPKSVGLLWTNDQLVAVTSTWYNTEERKLSMPPARFEPAIPASERPQTDALDRAAADIGVCIYRPMC